MIKRECGVMSERTSPGLTPLVLIDTHCHAHVLVESGTGCCSATTTLQTQPVNISSSNTTTTTRGSHCDVSNEGRGVRAEITDSGGGRKGSVAAVLPEVVHMTMGITEDDWHGAVAFAAGAEHLQRRGIVASAAVPARAAGEEDENSSKAEKGESTTDFSFFKFGLGLHPWYAHARSEEWLRDLTALLEQHPHALVGEIGLDKVARTPDTRRVEWDDQLGVFQTQMELAARMSRPVSVHCVKAHGKLVDCLRGRGGGGDGWIERKTGRPPAGGQKEGYNGLAGERKRWRLPPRIALHSFTGSVEVAEDITRLGARRGYGSEVFFGFSAAVNMRGDRETKRLIGECQQRRACR
ncbi:unnamed protein product [Ectocarpus sp. 12 AP-2014]